MRVEVNGVRLFFDVEGAKLRAEGPLMREVPTLLLLHGGPGFDHSTFKPEFSDFVDVAQVVYLDHRGNGRSDGRDQPERWNLEQWADDVRAFCEALEIERPIVIGVSFGGFVAMAYASRHPDHPGKLVLCSTAGRMRFDRTLAEFKRLGGTAARAAAGRFFDNPGPETLREYVERCFPLYTRTPRDPNVLARTMMNEALTRAFFGGEIRRFNLLPGLSRIKCPTLVAAGEEDPITPVADSQDIVAALPPHLVRFERFPNSGHGVVQDAREPFLSLLREFIAS